MPSKVFKVFLVVAFLIVAFSLNAFAWGSEGHQITVRIAAGFLNPSARAEVIKLLKVDAANNEPYYKQNCPQVLDSLKMKTLSAIDESALVSDGLACVASWADPPVKRFREYTSNWHFVDIPVVRATSAKPFLYAYNPARDCVTDSERGDCAIQALERFQPVLANYKNPAATDGHQYGEELTIRAEALKFFVHITGDLHQPLHCATDQKTKADAGNPKNNGDMGGNLKYVTWFGVATTRFGANELHSVWDEDFIGRTMQNKSMTQIQYAQYLANNISPDNLKAMQSPPADFQLWANESYNLSVTNAYGKLPKIDASCKVMKTATEPLIDRDTKKPVTGCYHLDEDYYNANNPIVEQQLKSGGARLSGLLNSILNN